MLKSVVALCAGIACLAMTAPAATAPSTSAPASAVTTVFREGGYMVNGVYVRSFVPRIGNVAPPVILVHGGMHRFVHMRGFASQLATLGYTVYAFDWLHHGVSAELPLATFLNRSIADVAHREIRDVVQSLGGSGQPILIGHSMGALAALAYAASYPVSRLVLLAPVLPSAVGAPPITLSIDLSQPFGPFPFEVARQLFYPTLDLATAQEAYGQLGPESPRAAWEATRWTVNVNLQAVTAPTFVIGAQLDTLTPPNWVQVLAGMLGAPYHLELGLGHSDLLLKSPNATQLVSRIDSWLGW
jgi:pimeloyl-ACP methyl ester carboxylesterase